jgi:3-oxoacyl-[acyl-carrier protein] reductase
MDLAGKVAVVTGAGRGIGSAIALSLGEAGADLVIADLDESRARETADRVRQLGRKACAVEADVSLAEAVNGLFSIVQSEFRRIDILVNNAGIWFRKPFWDISDDEWDQVLATNLKGTFMCTQRAARMMMPRKTGCIINIASQAGLFYSRGQGAHYAASKAGMIQLTRVLAFELGPFDIRINAIAPGAINTPASSAVNQDRSSSALSRRGEPEEIAQAALFLASPMASFVTGQTLVVNGGGIGAF